MKLSFVVRKMCHKCVIMCHKVILENSETIESVPN